MSTLQGSHAEPTLFLTSDEKVQVRAHKKRDGRFIFCAVDFIRSMLVEKTSYNKALMLWIKITLSNLQEVITGFNIKLIKSDFFSICSTMFATINACSLLDHTKRQRLVWKQKG